MQENWTEIKVTVENTITKITEWKDAANLSAAVLCTLLCKKKLNLKALELTYFFTPLEFRRDIAQEYMKLNLQELKLCTKS